MVIVDTNVLIDLLRQKEKETLLIEFLEKNPQETLAVSVITVEELYEGKSTRDSQKEQQVLALLSSLQILPYNFEVAQLGGKLARDYGPMELADAAIAATTIINQAKLLTLNKKDFSRIKQLELTE